MLFGELKGMSPSESKKWSLDFLKKVDLDGKEKLRLDKLSGGQQQKIQLGVTIMNDPDVLILDEPTKGFDPVNRRLLMDIIMEYKKRGATIIFITHNMDEVEKICDRILLLKDGKIAATGKVADVKKKYNGKSLDDIFVEIYGAIDYEKA